MILLDTEEMKYMVHALSDATERINDAASQLLAVDTHDNWTCVERDDINRRILDNRSQILRLRADSQSFLAAVRHSAERFEEDEAQIQTIFSGIDSMIGASLAVPSSTSAVGYMSAWSGALDNFADLPVHTGTAWPLKWELAEQLEAMGSIGDAVFFDPKLNDVMIDMTSSILTDIIPGGNFFDWANEAARTIQFCDLRTLAI